jgi:hypothetical protein
LYLAKAVVIVVSLLLAIFYAQQDLQHGIYHTLKALLL